MESHLGFPSSLSNPCPRLARSHFEREERDTHQVPPLSIRAAQPPTITTADRPWAQRLAAVGLLSSLMWPLSPNQNPP